jgi:hypothetical protein
MKSKLPNTILEALRRGGRIRAAQITHEERIKNGKKARATWIARARAQEAAQKAGAL